MSVMFISSTSLPAQSYNTSSSKAIKYFEKARQEFLCKNYDEALLNVDKALQKDDEFADAYLLKAELYLELNDDSLAMESYENIFKIDSMSFPKSSIVLSKLYSEYLQFDKSIRLLEWYLSLDGQSDKLRKLAEQQLHLAYFRKSLVENPVDYSPRNIGPACFFLMEIRLFSGVNLVISSKVGTAIFLLDGVVGLYFLVGIFL